MSAEEQGVLFTAYSHRAVLILLPVLAVVVVAYVVVQRRRDTGDGRQAPR